MSTTTQRTARTGGELQVRHAGPLATVQDGGRPGWLRYGIPRSGPQDRFSHAVANLLCGRPAEAAAIEVSAGGLRLQFNRAVTIGYASAALTVSGDRTHDEQHIGQGAVTLDRGALVAVAPFQSNWTYLAVAAELRVPQWLASSSTHSQSGLGGGILQTGDVLALSSGGFRPDLDGPLTLSDQAERTDAADDHPPTIRVVLGPQQAAFAERAPELLTSETFTVTIDQNRMGTRLDGPCLNLDDALTIPSEPAVRGSIQVSGNGKATVLMADHQTTGGYPTIATVLSTDTDRLARLQPGRDLRFRSVSASEAVALVRAEVNDRDRLLAQVAAPDRTLAQRLARHRLQAQPFAPDNEADS